MASNTIFLNILISLRTGLWEEQAPYSSHIGHFIFVSDIDALIRVCYIDLRRFFMILMNITFVRLIFYFVYSDIFFSNLYVHCNLLFVVTLAVGEAWFESIDIRAVRIFHLFVVSIFCWRILLSLLADHSIVVMFVFVTQMQLQGTEYSVYLDMLRLFSHGTWSDYRSKQRVLMCIILNVLVLSSKLLVNWSDL